MFFFFSDSADVAFLWIFDVGVCVASTGVKCFSLAKGLSTINCKKPQYNDSMIYSRHIQNLHMNQLEIWPPTALLPDWPLELRADLWKKIQDFSARLIWFSIWTGVGFVWITFISTCRWTFHACVEFCIRCVKHKPRLYGLRFICFLALLLGMNSAAFMFCKWVQDFSFCGKQFTTWH